MEKKVKCVIWDLDNTLWRGILLEDPQVTVDPAAVAAIKELDARGILHSVASRNDPALALARLRALGLDEYMLYPQIGWHPKSASVAEIAAALNIGVDSLAFVDDDPFERDEVAFTHPEVLCIDAARVASLADMPEMQPRFITEDSANRRAMYRGDIDRKRAEESFAGTADEFLATLGMVFTIARAHESDLQRAEELTVRTNQLNTTGYTYSYDELRAMLDSDRHLLLIASLRDSHGDYGKIGLAMVEKTADDWKIRLLLMSCRVMSRGVGTILLHYILQRARDAGVRLLAEFVETDRNRMMYVTYRFAGFREIERDGRRSVLEHDLHKLQPFPAHVVVHTPDDPSGGAM